MWDLIKDFILLFSTKGRRTLRGLEKVQDKTFRIQESLQKSRKAMTEALTEAKTEHGLASTQTKECKKRIKEVENAFLTSVDRAAKLDPESEDGKNNLEDQGILNNELQTLEIELQEYVIQEEHLKNLVDSIEDRRDILNQDIAEADRLLRVSEARYRTAETLLKANAGVLDESVFKEIQEIRDSSTRLQQKSIAIAEVSDKDRKKDVKNVIQNMSAGNVSIQERADKIRSQRDLNLDK